MIAVAFTVSGLRQKYLRAALDTWAHVRGIEKARLIFSIEPGNNFPVAEFQQFISQSFPGQARVEVADQKLGCLRNTRRAMDLALGEADFGVVAEEDLHVSDDVLEYLSWASEQYRDDSQVTTVCAHVKDSKVKDPAAVTRASWFNPLVWGTWRDSWEGFVRPGWGPCPGNHEGWDRNLQVQVSATGKQSVFPVLSRVIHRGETSTLTSLPLSEFFYREFLSHCFQPHYEPQAYKEVPFPIEPGDLVV